MGVSWCVCRVEAPTPDDQFDRLYATHAPITTVAKRDGLEAIIDPDDPDWKGGWDLDDPSTLPEFEPL